MTILPVCVNGWPGQACAHHVLIHLDAVGLYEDMPEARQYEDFEDQDQYEVAPQAGAQAIQ